MLKSQILQRLYKDWQTTATPAQIALVDAIYAECEKHYSGGGDIIVECFTPQEIDDEFDSVEDVRDYCGLKVEQALNARWGEDSDPELERARRFEENWKNQS